MAFSATITKGGVSGTSHFIIGTWSGGAGDDSGELVVDSNFVRRAVFTNEDADNPKEVVQVDVTYGIGTATITVHNHQNVAQGKFVVEFE